ncbi:protein of unknown function [Maridesulfovibrio hydrothermalis AM13 = DSM 14728]|uniref:Uncharacterized protein n=1 Tax=Maridesulfovibrio hydrothermalis AM13 = DSM 14728 TaxID=1121451 RepID=L0RER9_9BACT|nr:protein of unknown function [Maridesulfovibrio hydrothermalis AM13 = DSM 14728]
MPLCTPVLDGGILNNITLIVPNSTVFNFNNAKPNIKFWYFLNLF